MLTCMHVSDYILPAKKLQVWEYLKKIFADIGDDQSITAHLVTFSAHLKNIVNIVENSDNNTLV